MVRNLFGEFKTFAFKGNMIDLAVGIVIGAAFTGVVNSLVKNVMMPLIGYVTPGVKYEDWKLGNLNVGLFVGDVINFLIVALAVFLLVVKIVGVLVKKAAPPPPAGEPTVRECPHCLSEVPVKATRCRYCTSDITPTSNTALPAV